MFVNCCSEIGANCYYIICMHNTHEPNHGHLYGHMISLQYLRHGFFFSCIVRPKFASVLTAILKVERNLETRFGTR